jgi:F420-dependent oxidoreductase-like protein
MRFRIFVEPQEGATYDEQCALARHAEALGFDAFFRSDHYISFFGSDGLPGPTDAWVTLAGLARDTTRIRLGTLVSPVTFRPPGPLAITVAQVDAMSGGRVELGLGAGWNDAEHAAYGLPFPSTGERFDRLAEQLEIVTGLWTTDAGARFTHLGRHYTLTDSPALPKPVQRPHPPLWVACSNRETIHLAAQLGIGALTFAFIDPREARQWVTDY